MRQTLDFDAFRAERKREPVMIRIGGKVYSLAPALPAALALDVVRLSKEQDAGDDVKPEDLINVGSSLFGSEEKFREMLVEGEVALDEIADIVKMLLEAYTAEVAPPNPKTQA
jgi:hypothetical protein